ncbi:BLOC-1-related complex subunit 8 isoform X1 [Vombatus ursinus]|uniref:BLOC-1-related complex subunit 8 isoform X1 n=1 Tax=Vombatus ursinus TaxID=29139 RepID=UPI000FFD4D09|nr:BLOC-1-related complex subunit 8 isoform X1 [Vombatus ursinus]XP_027706999.1 BLOC-1-related complex subunit 8 isoform X1 [Vombatus ursinus]
MSLSRGARAGIWGRPVGIVGVNWETGHEVRVTDKFTESVYVLANEPSVALYRLQEHVRRSLPELAQHKSDMQNWEEQSQGAIYTVEYACSAVKNLMDSNVHFRSIEGLLKQAISIKDQLNTSQGRSPSAPKPPSLA